MNKKLRLEVAERKMMEIPVIIKEIEIKEIEKQVIVPQIEYRIIEVPVIVKEIEFREIEKERHYPLIMKVSSIIQAICVIGLLLINLIKGFK